MPTLGTEDITALTAGLTDIFGNMFSFLVTAAPLIAIVVAGKWAVGYVRKLAAGRK